MADNSRKNGWVKSRFVLSILTCAISFPKKIIDRDWPEIIDEPVDQPGGFIHRMNNVAVETVRGNANFFTKAFSFATVGLTAILILALVF